MQEAGSRVKKSRWKVNSKVNPMKACIKGHKAFMQGELGKRCLKEAIKWLLLEANKIPLWIKAFCKEFVCNAGVPDLIPGQGGSPLEGNSNPLQYSCLENSIDRGVWWAIAHGVTTESDKSKWLRRKSILNIHPQNSHIVHWVKYELM